jgi:hypothetical protein
MTGWAMSGEAGSSLRSSSSHSRAEMSILRAAMALRKGGVVREDVISLLTFFYVMYLTYGNKYSLYFTYHRSGI